MRQSDLHRAVARVLGESVDFISRRGFGPLEPLPDEPDLEERIVDWDQAALERNTALFGHKQNRAVA